MITQALETVTAISQQLQMPMLETLLYIRRNTEEFSLAELRDYYIVMADFEKLLAPRETV
jgi:hypothetical protein